jgi:hypothetical protein
MMADMLFVFKDFRKVVLWYEFFLLSLFTLTRATKPESLSTSQKNDWESKNEDLKLSTVEATLKQIEQRVIRLHPNPSHSSQVAYLAVNFKVSKQRMAVLGEGINTTANRIPFFTACFVSTVIIFGLAQMFYLRAFFAKRKLI